MIDGIRRRLRRLADAPSTQDSMPDEQRGPRSPDPSMPDYMHGQGRLRRSDDPSMPDSMPDEQRGPRSPDDPSVPPDHIPISLQMMLDRVHKGITVFDFDGKMTPCIVIEESEYDRIMSDVMDKPVSVNTDLNIHQDGTGNVFVEVVLRFSVGDIVERFLINASTDLEFFETLAQHAMLALTSPKSRHGAEKVYMIQLPRQDRARRALEMIKSGLNPKGASNAVTFKGASNALPSKRTSYIGKSGLDPKDL